jgi:hypothetical protein
MPYPETEDVEKFRLMLIRCLKLLRVADMVTKTKFVVYVITNTLQPEVMK